MFHFKRVLNQENILSYLTTEEYQIMLRYLTFLLFNYFNHYKLYFNHVLTKKLKKDVKYIVHVHKKIKISISLQCTHGNVN